MEKIKGIFLLLILVCIIGTRFVNLFWGLPYPFHPDERNMIDAMMRFACNTEPFPQCLNPEFFAYGQFPLYVGYFFVQLYHLVTGAFLKPVQFPEGMMVLRLISAAASVATFFFLVRALHFLLPSKEHKDTFLGLHGKEWTIVAGSLVFIFSPVLIQAAHFGTTESLLTLFVTMLTFYSLALLHESISPRSFAIRCGIICGLALGTKVSSVVYMTIPLLAILFASLKYTLPNKMRVFGIPFFLLLTVSATIALLSSPFNFIDFQSFQGSMNYEVPVVTGELPVFYTRQFFMTIPIVFHFLSVFPYALGLPVMTLFLLGFFLAPWNRKTLLIRIIFLFLFVPNAFMYAKWTRFITPVVPLMLILAFFMLVKAYEALSSRIHTSLQPLLRFGAVVTMLVVIIPGIAFTGIYVRDDIRLTASEWIYDNISKDAYILSETANVIDIPIPKWDRIAAPPYLNDVSFDFYHVDQAPILQADLEKHIAKAQYIFMPSRRLYKNHTCMEFDGMRPIEKDLMSEHYQVRCIRLEEMYPVVNEYYESTVLNKDQYELVAEFSSYPKIQLGRFVVYEQKDETAEETWTVFDHPVIRIYKKK